MSLSNPHVQDLFLRLTTALEHEAQGQQIAQLFFPSQHSMGLQEETHPAQSKQADPPHTSAATLPSSNTKPTDNDGGGHPMELLAEGVPQAMVHWPTRWRELATFDRRHIDALLELTDDFEMVSDCCLWLLLLTDQELPPNTDLDNMALYWDSGDRCATAFAHIQTTLLLLALDHGRPEHCDHVLDELYSNDIAWRPWLAVLEPNIQRRCLRALLNTALTRGLSEYNPYVCVALMHAHLTLNTSWPEQWDTMLTQSLRYVTQHPRNTQTDRWLLQPLEEQLHGLLCALPEPRRIAVLANVGQDLRPRAYYLSTTATAQNARWILEQLAQTQDSFVSIVSQHAFMSHTLGAVETMGEVLYHPLSTWPLKRTTPSIARIMRLCANRELLPKLLSLLAHEQHTLRLEAARGIAWLGPEQAQEPLLEFWRSNTVWPKDTSHQALTEGLVTVHRLWAGSSHMHKALSIPDELPEQLRHSMETFPLHSTDWFVEEETLWRATLHTAAAPIPLTPDDDQRDANHVGFLSELRRLFQTNAKVCWTSDMFDAWGHDPQATVATLELGLTLPSEATRKGRHDHLRDTLKAAPPQTAASLLTHRLMTAHLAAPYTLYAVLCGLKAETPDALHEAMLEHESQLIRDLAGEMLAQRPSALTRVPALLNHRLATVRASAAYCLQRTGTKAACDPLREALSREQTQSVRKAITTALAVLDPDQYSYRGEPHRRFGIYPANDMYQVNGLLEQLRELTHGSATRAAWVQAVDVLERMRSLGAVTLGAGYLKVSSLARRRFSIRPVHWDLLDEPALEGLGVEAKDPLWLPLTAFRDRETRQAFIDAGLARLELGDHKPSLRGEPYPDWVNAWQQFQETNAQFMDHVFRGWLWCAQHNIKPEQLTIHLQSPILALRGGKTYNMEGIYPTLHVHLELWLGFGVQFVIKPPLGLVYSDQSQDFILASTAELTTRVRLKPRHPLRSEPALKPWLSRGYLNLEALWASAHADGSYVDG